MFALQPGLLQSISALFKLQLPSQSFNLRIFKWQVGKKNSKRCVTPARAAAKETRGLSIFATPATESGGLKTCLWRFCKRHVCVLAVISWHFPLSKNYVNCKFLFKIHFWLFDILTLVSWSRQLPSCCRGEMLQLEFRSPKTKRWNFISFHFCFRS